MPQLSFLHQLVPEQDLTHKASKFHSLLDELNAAGTKLTQTVQIEMEAQSGELVDQISDQIQKDQTKQQEAITQQKASMTALAFQYSSFVNSMNRQMTTIHYEEDKKAVVSV
ncbi:hypothetical protein GKZ89_16820 [Bacillus mangrovi]|uniref:LXG domain-containing protein n=1 Tax=Metabacillus mangrovi TaxID=1491830 RepID=A0A7X2S7E7_9BACI|nr:hypothetical protein [Metabacillus mangrovi]MTH55069.1 hypothetical protein [Metabacillus mangrovi]